MCCAGELPWGGLQVFGGWMFAEQSFSGLPVGEVWILAQLWLTWGTPMGSESPKASEKLKLKLNSYSGSYAAVVTVRSSSAGGMYEQSRCLTKRLGPVSMESRGFWCVAVSCDTGKCKSRLCPLPLGCLKCKTVSNFCGVSEACVVPVNPGADIYRLCLGIYCI